ncbi:MAG: PKD domain-containing protein [Anaerolineae bacterium]|nr:PKD domain-containing protein [Anaerolineae bacterium]
MNRKFRAAWLLLTTISLLSFLLGGGFIYATPSHPALSSQTTISGPLELSLSVTPAVARPRDPVSVEMVLANHQGHVATPELVLHLPAALSPRGSHLPGGTVFNFQENTLSWLPVVPANGGTVRLELAFVASVADLNQPGQPVAVSLRYDGQEYSNVAELWVGLPPSVAVRTSPAMVSAGAPVQLTAITGGSGPFVQRWNLGDGRHLVARDPQVVYANPGTYRVTVSVANPLASTTATAGITVVASPTAAFTLDDPLPVAGQPVQFLNQSGGQQPQTYRWDFGDGTISSEADPTHEFQAPGSYTVRLLVESEYGVAETNQIVTVGAGPIVDFVIDGSAGTGRPVRGQAYSDDSVTTLTWDMGDGRQVEGEHVEHVYFAPGDYLVTVRGDNEYASGEVSRWIQISAEDFFSFLPVLGSPSRSTPGEVVIVAPDATTVLPPAAPAPANSPSAPATVLAPTPQANMGAMVQPGGAGAPPERPADLMATDGVTALQPTEPVLLPAQPPLAAGASPAETLLWYINEARRLHNLAPLSYSYELSIAAQMHSEDMAGNPNIMHDGSDGSTPMERQRRFGYQGFYGGEAVAWGWDSAVPVVEFWVNSPPHRVLLLDPNISEVGIGYHADGRAPNIWYWTAEFGLLPGSEPEQLPSDQN